MRTMAGLLLLLALAAAGCSSENPSRLAERQAADQIRRLGAQVDTDANVPDHPVVFVDFNGAKVGDAALVPLREFNKLRWLNLNSTGITDAGMGNLKDLDHLEWLFLNNTKVGDAGVKQLDGLHQLRCLNLGNTRVTDVGMQHVAALSKLDWVNLSSTRVTDQGVNQLLNARPQCHIITPW